MQLLYYDRKVVSPDTGISAYRVQGTNGWVFDKWDNGENKVQVGLFVYEVAEESPDMFVYKLPVVREKLKQPLPIKTGEIIVCDAIQQSPVNHSINGPFL